MQFAVTSRRKAIAFFIVLGACSAALALALNITWVIHWREVGMAVVGILFFGFIIAGVTLNTVFLVREIRRNEQHDAFLNAVTHELKTPVASIRLYLETLQARKVDEAKRQQFYSVMLEDTDRLLSTVEQVLRASQLAQRGRQQSFHPVDLAEIAGECVELARTRHHLDALALQFHNYAVGKEETQVMGDSDELRTAVMNLLDNAVKYSGEKVRVTVGIAAEGGNAVLRVSDQGIGIPRGELKRIFRRFYRAPQKLKARIKGTGLGLFIVRSIAQRHGGDAMASSEGEGKGATLSLRLPRVS